MDTLLYGLIAGAIAAIAFFLLRKKPKSDAETAHEDTSAPELVSAKEPTLGTGGSALKANKDDKLDTLSRERQGPDISDHPVNPGLLNTDDSSEAARERPPAQPLTSKPPSSVPATPAGLVEEVSRPSALPAVTEKPAPSVGPSEVEAETPRHAKIEGLREGLSRSRSGEGFFGRLKSLFASRKQLDESVAEEIEEILLSSDVGVKTTADILERLRNGLTKGDLKSEDAVWEALRTHAKELVQVGEKRGALVLDAKPTVVLLVGVNGAGKTTTIGKLATQLKSNGKTCILAAGDTFRAAAVQQLVVWGKRVGCEVIHGKDGADPGAVLFDAVRRAEEIGADVVLADTAGRLHTKSNLMAEMQKIARTIGKAMPAAPHETLIVIDSTNGQNALAQAREFRESLNLTGVVLTKLDGTAKGGVVLGIADSLNLPVRYVGLGERPDDLHEFSADEFVEALLGKDG